MKLLKSLNKKHLYIGLIILVIILIGIIILFAVLQKQDSNINESNKHANFEYFISAIDTMYNQYEIISVENNIFVENFNSLVAEYFSIYTKNNNIFSRYLDPWDTAYMLIVSVPLNTNGEVDVVSAGPDKQYFTNDDKAVRIVCNIDKTVTTIDPFSSEHEHKFETLDWGSALIHDATCVNKPLFYESCRHCKLKNNMSFEFGTVNENIHGNIEKVYFYQDERMHLIKSQCSECHAVVHEVTEMHNKNLSCCSNQ